MVNDNGVSALPALGGTALAERLTEKHDERNGIRPQLSETRSGGLMLSGRPWNGSRTLLVLVLDIALVLLGQGGHDDAVGFVHGAADVLGAVRGGEDGLVDDEAHGVAVDKVDAGHAGEHVERTVDGEGDDRQLQLVGQLERALAEQAHVAGEAAGAFGEDDERCAALQGAAGVVDGFLDGLGAGFVHEDVARLDAGIAHQRHLAQGFLHHPLEIAAQVAVDEEDVERSLVVGHEHVALPAVYIFTAFDVNGQ